jgi:uncharacterized protein
VLVFALSVPFWLIGALAGRGLPLIPIDLPVSALQFVCPLVAAVILVHRDEGGRGVRRLLLRVVDPRGLRPRIWFLPIVFLMPAILLLSYGVMSLLGRPLPDPDIPPLVIPVFVVIFFFAAAGEEAGWTGYVLEPLQDRWGAAGAGVVLGVVWGSWHLVAWFLQAGHTAAWTAGQFLGSIALRILIVWLYNSAGRSVLAAVLFHDMINVSEFLFPNYGSHYDPVVTGVILAITAVLVTFLWGRRSADPEGWSVRNAVSRRVSQHGGTPDVRPQAGTPPTRARPPATAPGRAAIRPGASTPRPDRGDHDPRPARAASPASPQHVH